MEYKSEITIEASDLVLGDTKRTVCPRCMGGSSTEKSLSITLSDEGLVWNCFRAKCGLKGGTGAYEISRTSSTKSPPSKPKPRFSAKTMPLSEEHLYKIETLWGIRSPKYWWWTDAHGGRVAMSIRSPKFTPRGWVLRDIHGKQAQKALTYLDENEESLSWYKNRPAGPTVLVEDIPSAIRASSYGNSVALLGTAIGLGKAEEISKYATRPIVIALDQDATEISFEHQNKWGLFWDDVRILPLKKDIKDMSEEELQCLLKLS